MGDEAVPAIEEIKPIRPVERLRDRDERPLLSRQDFIVNGAGVEAVLGVSRQIANAQQAEDLLHGEDREVVNLTASIDERLSRRRPMSEQQLRKASNGFLIADGASRSPGDVQHARADVDWKGRTLAHHRGAEFHAACRGRHFREFRLGDGRGRANRAEMVHDGDASRFARGLAPGDGSRLPAGRKPPRQHAAMSRERNGARHLKRTVERAPSLSIERSCRAIPPRARRRRPDALSSACGNSCGWRPGARCRRRRNSCRSDIRFSPPRHPRPASSRKAGDLVLDPPRRRHVRSRADGRDFFASPSSLFTFCARSRANTRNCELDRCAPPRRRLELNVAM